MQEQLCLGVNLLLVLRQMRPDQSPRNFAWLVLEKWINARKVQTVLLVPNHKSGYQNTFSPKYVEIGVFTGFRKNVVITL